MGKHALAFDVAGTVGDTVDDAGTVGRCRVVVVAVASYRSGWCGIRNRRGEAGKVAGDDIARRVCGRTIAFAQGPTFVVPRHNVAIVIEAAVHVDDVGWAVALAPDHLVAPREL